MAVSGIQYLIHPLGLPLRVVQWGLSGETVLMLHGLGSRAETFEPVAARLARQGYRCLALDLPGHGLSAKGDHFDYTAEGHARLLAAVCDLIGAEPVHLVASSLGGIHAAAFATTAPARLRSLTLIGSIGLQAMTPERRQWTADYLKDMSREAIARRFAFAVADATIFDDAYIEESHRTNTSAGAAEAFARIGAYYLGTINDDVQTERLAALGGIWPLLLLWGRGDATVTLDAAQGALARVPRSTLAIVEGARHIPHLEQPELVAGALATHFAEAAGTAGSFPAPLDLLRHG
ncbi:MAG: alpha/beta fold hydrolase [Zavarzinia sp.]|nr:alpha/beta fold hydrolase [Zavarzinia sp.]